MLRHFNITTLEHALAFRFTVITLILFQNPSSPIEIKLEDESPAQSDSGQPCPPAHSDSGQRCPPAHSEGGSKWDGPTIMEIGTMSKVSRNLGLCKETNVTYVYKKKY